MTKTRRKNRETQKTETKSIHVTYIYIYIYIYIYYVYICINIRRISTFFLQPMLFNIKADMTAGFECVCDLSVTERMFWVCSSHKAIFVEQIECLFVFLSQSL